MINSPICGDRVKCMDNFVEPVFTYFASIKGFIHKIVTKTEILALVSLLLGTNFKIYRPTLGDIPNSWMIWIGHLLLIWLQSTFLWHKLWPRLKFWHWSLCYWVPATYDIDQHLVTSWQRTIYRFYSWKIDHWAHLQIQSSTFWVSRQPNIVVSMLRYDNWLLIIAMIGQRSIIAISIQ